MENTTAETKKTVTVIDKATKALTKTVADLIKTSADMAVLTAVSEELSIDIEMKSAELANINAQTAFKLRDAKADLDVEVKENANFVLDTLMTDRKLAVITFSELASLKDELIKVNEDVYDEVDKAVNNAVDSLRMEHALKSTQQQSRHEVDTAELNAANTALSSRIEFLTESNTSLQGMLNDEREARVEVSKNSSPAPIHVNTTK